MSKGVEKLKRTINELAKANIKLTLVRGVVKDIDWDAKTMTVISLVDDLEYFDVLLGLGSIYQKPKANTNCIIGVYDGHKTAGFLIDVDEVEEAVYTSDQTTFIIKEEGFVIQRQTEDLITVFNDMIDEINKIIVINGTTINVAAMTAIKDRLNTILTT